MRESFEDLVAKELDSLYQGALFLCAGDESAAEDLILDVVTRARYSWPRVAGRPGTGNWLCRVLAQEFLARRPRYRLADTTAEPPPEPPTRSERDPGDDIDPKAQTLYRAAGSTPHAARPALWLVLVRRWSYAEVAEALGIGIEELPELLDYRTTLAAAVADDGRRPDSAATG